MSPPPPPAPAEPPLVDRLIAKSSDRIASAWEMMARTEAAGSPVQIAAPIDVAKMPPSLRMPVTWDWSGPADQAVEAIAGRIGYSFRRDGDRPAVPVVVSVHASGTPAILVLRDIGLQAGTRARIDADPNPPGSITYTTIPARS